jgi:hypothetical protein
MDASLTRTETIFHVTRRRGVGPCRAVVLALLVLVATAPAAAEAPADSSMALAGDRESTVFRSLTVEGENRVRVTFERPDLAIELDPAEAPGLTWGSPLDALNRTMPDLEAELLTSSARFRSPYEIRPWLAAYETGPVAHFNFDMENVHRWNLLVVDSRGSEVARFAGKKNPPRRLAWDGATLDGERARPGLTYSYVLEAFDKAGNRRRFVGEGFDIAPYRREDDGRPEFLVSGTAWAAAAPGRPSSGSPYLLETASRLVLHAGADEQVTVTATAGTYAEARDLGDRVAEELRGLLPGDASRIAVATVVEPGTPPGGLLRIRVGGPGSPAGK